MPVSNRWPLTAGRLLAVLAAVGLFVVPAIGQSAPAKQDPPPEKEKKTIAGIELDLPKPGPDGRLSEEQQKDLTEQIRKAIEAEMSQAAKEAAKPAEAKPSPERHFRTAPVQNARTGGEAQAEGKAGCGATPGGDQIDLNPPAADQPQPKFVCEQTKLVLDGVWQGQPAEFVFKIKNAGEGPLAIRLKGG